MELSIKWLKELVSVDVPLADLVKDIGLRSVEVNQCKPLVVATNLVVGHVLTREKHPEADKLSVCTVDVGSEVLQIICGAPNVAANQKVIVAKEGAVLPGDFKIKKAKIRGIESNGMICSLDELGIEKKYHGEDGIHVLPEDSEIGSNPLSILHYDDDVLELELTPNKGYLLSMWGVAYDVAALLGVTVRLPKIDCDESNIKNTVQVSSTTPGCQAYYARVVDNIHVGESPYWLKARLIAAGIRPISNVVDITNYVMLELGQPLHAFDLNKLSTNTIRVRDAFSGETIRTLDGQTRTLTTEDIVITNGADPVAIAGVMGGADTEVDASTTSILIESAIFNPIRVRKTSRRLDLRSESSMRFERGLDPNKTALAADRAAMLLEELAGGIARKGVASFDIANHDENEVVVSLAKINQVLGTALEDKEVETIFDQLGFDYKERAGVYTVIIPTRRRDVSTDQELIEEIVRLVGFERIPTVLPIGNMAGRLTAKQQLRRRLASVLADLGLDEVVTYSLVSNEKATAFDPAATAVVSLMHPMSEDRGVLRHSLIPSLLDSLQYNLARKAQNVMLYEIGRKYLAEGETELVSGVLTGLYGGSLWQGKKEPVDFFLVKGLIEAALEAIGVKHPQFAKPLGDLPKLHPGIAATISIDGQTIGFLGKLHPQVEATWNLPPTYVFELDFDVLAKCSEAKQPMQELSKFPRVNRDIAVVVDEAIPAGAVIEHIKAAVRKQLIDVKVFDLYRGESVGLGKKSLAIALGFQDASKTLETAEVDQLVSKILSRLQTAFQATLRQ